MLRAVELEILRQVIPEYRDARRRAGRSSCRPRRSTTRSCRCCATPTSTCGRIPHSRMPRAAVPASGGRAPSSSTRAVGVPRAAVRPARRSGSGRRRVGVRRDGAARRGGRLPLDGDRRADPGADARRRVHPRRRRPRRAARDALSRRTVVGRASAQVACVFRDHVLSDLIGFTYCGLGRRTRRPTTSCGRLAEAGRRYARADRRGRGDHLRSSSTARTPGSTSRAAAGRSCARSTSRLASHPELRTVTMAEACAGAATRAAGIFPGLVDRRELLHLDWPRRRPAGLEPAGRRARRRSTRAAAASTPAALARAREEMLIAEGSDWFWWYGDDHSSDARPRVRRPVPAAPAERLPAARASRCPTSCSSATSRRGRRAPSQIDADRASSRRRSTARRRATSSGWAPGALEVRERRRGDAPDRTRARRW